VLKNTTPVSICHTYTEPSVQPTTMKSSFTFHRMVSTGKVCRLASNTVFRSRNPHTATEWSWPTEQMHCWKRCCKTRQTRW